MNETVIHGAMIASLRERIAAGETVDDLGRNIWVVLAALLCKRAELSDDEEQALADGREALALLTDRAGDGDEEAAAVAAVMVRHVPELGVA